MRVLISGITGFVGRHLAAALAARGDAVWGFSNEDAALGEARVCRVDLLDAAALVALLRRAAPDAVVHLAGLSHVGSSFAHADRYRRINVDGTRALLEAAAAAAPAARVVVASSAEVYGPVPEDEQPIVEQRPLDPRSPYAETKVAAEALARSAGAVVVRPFNIIGPGQASTFALPSFAAQLAAIAAGTAAPELQVGNLSPRRDFSHVADAAEGYRVLVERGEPGAVYNLASGEAHAMAEVLARLQRVAGVAAEVRSDPAKQRPVDAPLMRGDSSRLRALGWTPRYDLDDALRDLWRAASAAQQRGAMR